MNEVIKRASKSRDSLIELKETFVRLKEYDLAAQCRELELKLYPKTKAQLDAIELSKQLNLLFRMVNLDIPDKIAFTVYEAIKAYNRKKDKFDIKDAENTLARVNSLIED